MKKISRPIYFHLVGMIGLMIVWGCGQASTPNSVEQKTGNSTTTEESDQQPSQVNEDGSLVSGLQPGSIAGAFIVRDITGPMAGKSLCYR